MARQEVPCMQQACAFLTFAELLAAMACSKSMLAAVTAVHEIVGTSSWDAPHAGDEHAGPDQFLPSHLVFVKKLFGRLTSLTIQDCCLLNSSNVLDILKISSLRKLHLGNLQSPRSALEFVHSSHLDNIPLSIQDVHLHGVVTYWLFSAILQRCERLQQLSVDSIAAVDWTLLHTHLSNHSHLRSISLKGFIGNAHPPSSTPMSIFIPNLEHLQLSLLGCPPRWTVYGPNLLSCTLREHSANQTSIATIVGNAPELRRLHIRGTAGAVADMRLIHSALEEVVLENCTFMSTLFMNTPRLKSVRLSNCVELAGIAITSQSLQELDFQMFVSLVHLELRCVRLERLHLQGCARLGLADGHSDEDVMMRHIVEMGMAMASHIEAFLHAADTTDDVARLPPFANPLHFAAPVFGTAAHQRQSVEADQRASSSDGEADFATSSWAPSAEELVEPMSAIDIVTQLRRDCPSLTLTPNCVFNCPLSAVVAV